MGQINHTAGCSLNLFQIPMNMLLGVFGVSKNSEKFSTYEIDCCLQQNLDEIEETLKNLQT